MFFQESIFGLATHRIDPSRILYSIAGDNNGYHDKNVNRKKVK